jgi:MOSC domain-containing protein YiiM
MATFDELQSAYAALPKPNRERGTVKLIVLRLGGGAHETPASAELALGAGVVGDRWNIENDPDCLQQVTLMNASVAGLVCGDLALHMPGDNVLVDYDLSVEWLPAGARIRVGSAVLEITEKLHAGCARFSERFGASALRWVNLHDHRPLRLRGVNCRIVEAGTIAIEVSIERITG